jgi:putative PIN family toxin of toxin-antitoxin system
VSAAQRSTLRAVLDTSVVVSALVLRGGPGGRLRHAWQTGRVLPLVSKAPVQEFMRVLAYPKFKLSPADREELLADYLPWAEVVAIPGPPPRVPACRDEHDLPFLYLATAGQADVLVTGDADLLEVVTHLKAPTGPSGSRPARWRCRVLTLRDILDSLGE